MGQCRWKCRWTGFVWRCVCGRVGARVCRGRWAGLLRFILGGASCKLRIVT
jgi:hypothetical protein